MLTDEFGISNKGEVRCPVLKKVRRDRTKLIVDKALVSMLDRAVGDFTVQDVRGETIDLGYRYTPNGAAISSRLNKHMGAGLLRVVRERGIGGNPRVWAFTDRSGKLRGLIRIRLERARARRKECSMLLTCFSQNG